MLANGVNSESEENLLLLNFAARLLTAFTNREILLNIAVEHFADFAHSERVGILTLGPNEETLCFENVFVGKRVVPAKGEIALEGSPLADVFFNKNTGVYPLSSATPLPLPTFSVAEQSAKCLCLPMVSSDFRSVGVLTIEVTEEQQLSFEIMQDLRMLTTVLAISLEHAVLFDQVLKDGLTGVYVRKYGETRLTEELARIRRYSGSVAVIFFDIDRFKDINDSLGHQVGDQALREIAQAIQVCLRQDIDLVCRYGGDEFIVIVPNATPDETREIAERIRCECLKRFSCEPFTKVPVGVTGGVAVADHQTLLSAEELLKRADDMLYRAKRAGRNRIEVWKGD
jgi:two-component system, cell cycle response regulator